MKKFWSFQARSDGVGELYLYGEIADASWLGDEITPAQFARELDALGELRELYVNIHSPGGDAFAGIAIYNILQRCPAKKTVRIDGLAASAASLIAMSGDVIQMPKSATMMIHNAWARASGEAAQARKKPEPADEAGKLFARALSGSAAAVQQYRAAAPTLGDEDQAGALTAPMQFVEQLIKGLDNMLFMRQISHITPRLGAGQTLGFPYRATEAADAEWEGEVDAAAEETTLAYGRREFKPNRMAKLIKLSRTLVGHAPMAEGVVRDEMMYRIAITQEKAYMTGTGTGQPLGIFTANANGIPTTRDVATGNTQTAVTFDGLLEAKYAIKQQYWRELNWVMHRDAAKMLAKIKDSDGQYIWQPSVQLGQPDLLLGVPVRMSEYAPNTFTAGKYVAVLGDFRYYWICDADPLTIQVLTELYATTNQIGYLYHYFGDGAPVVGEAFSRVALAAAG